jgi:hypothetical protein
MMMVIVINIGITIDDVAGSVGDDVGDSFVIFLMSVSSIFMCDIPLCIESIPSINLAKLS